MRHSKRITKTKTETSASTHHTRQLPKLPRLRPHRPRIAVSSLVFHREEQAAPAPSPYWIACNHHALIFSKYFLEVPCQSGLAIYSIYTAPRNSRACLHILCAPYTQSGLEPLSQFQSSLESFGTPNIRLPQNLEIDKSKLQ